MTNLRSLLAVLAGLGLALAMSGSARADDYEWSGGKWTSSGDPDSGVPAELLAIRAHVEAGRASQAVKAVKKLLKTDVDEAVAEEAMLLAGQAELNRGHYYQAFEWFERQVTDYPSGAYFERGLHRQFQVGEAFLAGKKRIVLGFMRLPARDEGLKILGRIPEHAPGTLIAEEALLRVGEYYFDRAEYAEAVAAYDAHLKLFPKSERARESMFRAARATLALYRGPEYDDTPLLDAEQRYLEIIANYAQAARQANVPRTLENIRAARARKTFATAEFYVRTHRPQAAVFYGRRVVSAYPRTEWADRARQLLKGLPGAATRTE
jgi:outer membrane protein assembly factor BamD (BamD/ComL family)